MGCKIDYIYNIKGLTVAQADSLNSDAVSIWDSLKESQSGTDPIFRTADDRLVVKKHFLSEAQTIAKQHNESNTDIEIKIVQDPANKDFLASVDVKPKAYKVIESNIAAGDVERRETALGIDEFGDSNPYMAQITPGVTEEADKDLTDRLVNFILAKGFKFMDMDQYAKDYKTRTGEEFDAVALVDMLNQVVAVKSNEAKRDTLPEEVGHLALEMLGWDHPIVKPLLAQIDKTDTYQQVYDLYSKNALYQNKDGSVNELKIKQEAVGKLFASALIKKNEEIYGKLSERIQRLLQRLWHSFIHKFKTTDGKAIRHHIESSLGDKAASILTGDLNEFSTLEKKEAIFFQLDEDMLKMEDVLRKGIKKLSDRYQTLLKTKSDLAGDVDTEISGLKRQLENKQYNAGLLSFLKSAKENSKEALRFIEGYKAGDYQIPMNRLKDLQGFVGYYEDVVKDIRLLNNESDALHKDFPVELKEKVKGAIDELILNFMAIDDFYKEHSEKIAVEFIEETNKDENYNASKSLKSVEGDISYLQYYAGSIRNADDNLLRVIGKVVSDARNAVQNHVYDVGRELTRLVVDNNITAADQEAVMEHDENNEATGYIVSEYKLGQYRNDKTEFLSKLNEKYEIPEDPEAREVFFNDNPEIENSWRREWIDWLNDNTTPKDNWKDLKAEREEELSPSDYSMWYKLNINVWVDPRGGGVEFPKGELVRPADKYKNAAYDNLTDSQKTFRDALVKIKREEMEKQPIRYLADTELLKLPQISKRLIERIKFSRAGLKEIPELLKDELLSRADDDFSLQETIVLRSDGTQQKFVPIRYNRMLENTNDISRDLVGMFTQYADMSENFKQMSAIAPDIENIKDKVGDRDVITNKKLEKGRATRAFKALDTFVDMFIYGESRKNLEVNVHESIPLIGGKKINVTKISNNINTYVRAANLVGNFFTAATAAITGGIFAVIERYSGMYATKRSGVFAQKEFLKNFKQIVSEVGDVRKTNKMELLLDAHQVHMRSQEMFDNMNRSKFARFIDKNLMYGLYKAPDFKLKSVMAVAVYDNYRYINGKWSDHNGFLSEFSGTLKEADEKWDSHRDDSYYNAHELRDGEIAVKKEYADRITPEVKNTMVGRVRSVNSNIDGAVDANDRAAIHQGVWSQHLATHRGWMITGFQKRLKKRGFDYETGLEEEGYYRTVGNHLKKFIHAAYNPRLMKTMYESWDDLSDFEKTNLKRAVYELRAMVVTYIAAYILNKLADEDDDDEFMIQAAAYLGNRTLLEVRAFANPSEIPALLNSPAAGIRYIDMLMTPFDLFDTDILERGAYKGLPKNVQKLMKMTPGLKGWYESRDPKSKNKFLKQQIL